LPFMHADYGNRGHVLFLEVKLPFAPSGLAAR
jgi:hypothetical protein